MTPAARVSAAIDALDGVLSGAPAEQALTNWARANRYAGSGDRAAVRDLVFAALRRRRSAAAMGGGESARQIILGLLRQDGVEPATLFTGERFAPAPLTAAETQAFTAAPDLAALPEAVAADCPPALEDLLRADLDERFGPALGAMRERAPVFLRVNLARLDRAAAQARLAVDGIETRPVSDVKTGLEVTGNARKIRISSAYLDGSVELQDASSQAAVLRLPLRDGLRVLDYCAGGGGKTLAMAGLARAEWFVHDAAPARMADLPERARRAGISVRTLPGSALAKAAPFDLVLVDAPCTGAGTWRRTPDAKWRLMPADVAAQAERQDAILNAAKALVAPGGVLAYMTCSIFRAENEDRIAAFLARNPGWRAQEMTRFWPTDGGDGFCVALLARA